MRSTELRLMHSGGGCFCADFMFIHSSTVSGHVSDSLAVPLTKSISSGLPFIEAKKKSREKKRGRSSRAVLIASEKCRLLLCSRSGRAVSCAVPGLYGCTAADLYLGQKGFSWGCVKLELELSSCWQPGSVLSCSHGAVVWGMMRVFCVFSSASP